MAYLSSLKSIVRRKKRRLGRGYASGAGAKSGRGTKRHQKAREKIKPWFEGGQNPMVKKFPLLRGKHKNKSIKKKPFLVSIADLAKLPKGAYVSVELLIENNIVDKKARRHGVKIVANGELSKPLKIALPISKRARDIVEKCGGSVEVQS